MLSIKINNSIILPMRPEAPVKTFSSEDVPHGTQSVFYKAIKIYNSNGGNITLPQFTEEELAAHKEAFLAKVEVLPLLDSEGQPINYDFTQLAENQVMEPTLAEVEDEFYEPTTGIAGERTPKMVDSNDIMDMPSKKVQKYADFAACKASIINQRKDACAQAMLEHAIEHCLIVPELSEEFMAQFESFEVTETL